MPPILLAFALRDDAPAAAGMWATPLLDALDEAGLRATAFLTPALVRYLDDSSDTELLAKLARHELGLALTPRPVGGTAPASVEHPRPSWEAQLDAWALRLAAGSDELDRVFGCRPQVLALAPACFSPQAVTAASRAGLDVIAEAPFEAPAAGQPLAYCGAVLLRRHLPLMPLLDETADLDEWQDQLAAAIGAGGSASRGWALGADIGGPTPPEAAPNQTGTTKISRRTQQHLRHRLVTGLQSVGKLAGGPLTAFAALHPAAHPPLVLAPDDLRALARRVGTLLEPLQHEGQWLATAELFAAFVAAGAQLAALGDLVRPVFVRRLLGPRAPERDFGDLVCPRDKFLAVCQPLLDQCERFPAHVPEAITIGEYQVAPSCFLHALAACLRDDQPLVRVAGRPLPQYHGTRREVQETAAGYAEMAPPAARRQAEQDLLLQAWTAKPAAWPVG